jgi:hypothetical protein
MKQTAVEWLVEQLANEKLGTKRHFEIIQQAKQLEKDQIINAHIEGQPFHSIISYKAEQYYNQTFNK